MSDRRNRKIPETDDRATMKGPTGAAAVRIFPPVAPLFAIKPEEACLERKIGETCLACKRRVRRWLWYAVTAPQDKLGFVPTVARGRTAGESVSAPGRRREGR